MALIWAQIWGNLENSLEVSPVNYEAFIGEKIVIVHNKPTNIVIKKSPGAPTGLRWHWFRWCFLNSKLKNFYELIYDYTGDGYVLVRSKHRDDFTKKIGVSRRYDWEIFFRDQNEQAMLSLHVYGRTYGRSQIFYGAISGEIA